MQDTFFRLVNVFITDRLRKLQIKNKKFFWQFKMESIWGHPKERRTKNKMTGVTDCGYRTIQRTSKLNFKSMLYKRGFTRAARTSSTWRRRREDWRRWWRSGTDGSIVKRVCLIPGITTWIQNSRSLFCITATWKSRDTIPKASIAIRIRYIWRTLRESVHRLKGRVIGLCSREFLPWVITWSPIGNIVHYLFNCNSHLVKWFATLELDIRSNFLKKN